MVNDTASEFVGLQEVLLYTVPLGHAWFLLLAQVHKLRAGTDVVNWVLLALPRPRGRAKSGPLYSVAEQALASATVRKK